MAGNGSRRDFIARIGQMAAMVGVGGTAWAYLLGQQARATPFALRPPGALPEDDFHAACIKCGQCVRACPYDTLRLAAAGGRIPIGTPYFEPRDVPCYMCPDIPCKVACPTGALEATLDDIADARMGLAVIDIENCLSWQGLRCEICYRDCPLTGKAISIANHPRKVSKHALFVPLVHSSHCTGCGVCEKSCPTAEAAIRVVPAKMVQGRMGDHYRLGWKVESEITQDFQPASSPPVPAPADAARQATDYLNEGGL